MEKKICPMLYASDQSVDGICKETACAWWDANNCKCAIVGISTALNNPLNVYTKED